MDACERRRPDPLKQPDARQLTGPLLALAASTTLCGRPGRLAGPLCVGPPRRPRVPHQIEIAGGASDEQGCEAGYGRGAEQQRPFHEIEMKDPALGHHSHKHCGLAVFDWLFPLHRP
jgi:hypothetical protein